MLILSQISLNVDCCSNYSGTLSDFSGVFEVGRPVAESRTGLTADSIILWDFWDLRFH